jgi:hypothetical protein
MPLSPPDDRAPMHTRTIECRGFRRADGLWDIEGHLTDLKAYPFENQDRGTIEPGEPLHDMWIRVTVDDGMTIRAVEAVTDAAPYHVCPAITPNFQRLVGERIKPGFTGRVKQLLGGVEGCTHLVDLLGPVATTAFQTIFPVLARERAGQVEGGSEGSAGGKAGAAKRPVLLNTCHAFAADGPLVRERWPEHYTGDRPARTRTGTDGG